MTNKPMECEPIGYGFYSFTQMGWAYLDKRCREKKPHRHFLTPHEERTIYSPDFVPPSHYRRPPAWMYEPEFDWREKRDFARRENLFDYAHDQGERDLSHPQFQPIDSYTDNMEGVKKY